SAAGNGSTGRGRPAEGRSARWTPSPDRKAARVASLLDFGFWILDFGLFNPRSSIVNRKSPMVGPVNCWARSTSAWTEARGGVVKTPGAAPLRPLTAGGGLGLPVPCPPR